MKVHEGTTSPHSMGQSVSHHCRVHGVCLGAPTAVSMESGLEALTAVSMKSGLGAFTSQKLSVQKSFSWTDARLGGSVCACQQA